MSWPQPPPSWCPGCPPASGAGYNTQHRSAHIKTEELREALLLLFIYTIKNFKKKIFLIKRVKKDFMKSVYFFMLMINDIKVNGVSFLVYEVHDRLESDSKNVTCTKFLCVQNLK